MGRTMSRRRCSSFGWLCGFACLLASLTDGGLRPALGASGKLELTVVDRETGAPIACRVHLRNAAGRPRKPRGVPFWHDHFVFDGNFLLRLPLGQYFFELEKGPEYLVRNGHFLIERFADDSKEVDLGRFVDMSSHGWWSGDLDVHRPAGDIELLMRADDLHVVPVVTWSSEETPWQGESLPESPVVRFDGDRCYDLMAGEHVCAGGQLLFFNLPAPFDLDRASEEYPPPMVYAGRAREHEGAWVDLTKPFWWDLPVLVAHDQIDSIQIAHSHLGRDAVNQSEAGGKPRDGILYPGVRGVPRWSQAIYFHLLNCGISIPPSAGSGSGVSPNPVGYNRAYVHVDGELEYAKWWEGLRAGRVVVTNGPLLRPRVRGQLPGHVFVAEAGQELEFQVGLTLSTREPISYLELIKDGQIEHSVPFEEYRTSGKLPKLSFAESGWFLVRAVTDLPNTYRFAMTGPYYVEFDGRPRISRRSAQFFLDWVYERARQIQLDDPARHRAVIDLHRHARDFWKARVAEANAE